MGIHKHLGELGSVLIDTGEIMKFLFPYLYTVFRKQFINVEINSITTMHSASPKP